MGDGERERMRIGKLQPEWKAWISRLSEELKNIEKISGLEESLDIFTTIPSITSLGFKERNPHVLQFNEYVHVQRGCYKNIIGESFGHLRSRKNPGQMETRTGKMETWGSLSPPTPCVRYCTISFFSRLAIQHTVQYSLLLISSPNKKIEKQLDMSRNTKSHGLKMQINL